MKSRKVVYFYEIDKIVSVFANDPGDQGSIPDRVIPKTQENGQSRERSSAFSYTSV